MMFSNSQSSERIAPIMLTLGSVAGLGNHYGGTTLQQVSGMRVRHAGNFLEDGQGIGGSH